MLLVLASMAYVVRVLVERGIVMVSAVAVYMAVAGYCDARASLRVTLVVHDVYFSEL